MCGKIGQPVIIVGGEEEHCLEIGSVLREKAIGFTLVPLIEQLEGCLRESGIQVAIVDLDTTGVSNKFVRELRKRYPLLSIIGISGSNYHPELKEALSESFFACMKKPLDSDELLYLLRSILKPKEGSKDSLNG